MALFMKSLFIRKATYPLQLRHLKNSMRDDKLAWYNEIDDTVILGAIPLRRKSTWIDDLNLGGVVSLNEPYETKKTFSIEDWKKKGIANLKYKVPDHVGAATLDQVREIIAFIADIEERGKRVYVHCKAGKGRSASVVMCYLCQKQGLSPEDCFKLVQSKRQQIDLGAKQWRLVEEFCRTVASN